MGKSRVLRWCVPAGGGERNTSKATLESAREIRRLRLHSSETKWPRGIAWATALREEILLPRRKKPPCARVADHDSKAMLGDTAIVVVIALVFVFTGYLLFVGYPVMTALTIVAASVLIAGIVQYPAAARAALRAVLVVARHEH